MTTNPDPQRLHPADLAVLVRGLAIIAATLASNPQPFGRRFDMIERIILEGWPNGQADDPAGPPGAGA